MCERGRAGACAGECCVREGGVLGGGTRAGSPIWADSKRAGHTPGHTLTGGRTRQYARTHANTRAHTQRRDYDDRRGPPPGPPRNLRRSEHRVIVSGLPVSASWQDLKDFCRAAGDVIYTDVDRYVPRVGWRCEVALRTGSFLCSRCTPASTTLPCVCVCVCARARRHGRQARQYRRPACAAPMSVCARRASVCAQHTGACAQHTAVGARRQGGGIVEFANKSDQEYALSKLDDTEFTARNGDKVRRDSAESPVAAAHGARVRARLCAHVHTDAYACIQCRPT